MSRTGQCLDNASAEGFFAPLKAGLVHAQCGPARSEAARAIFEWIEAPAGSKNG